MNKILLLHGAIGSKEQLIPLAKLLEKDFEVLTLNFSGHGSEVFKAKFNISQFSNDVVAYLDQNKIEQLNIFGYSMGGYVAVYLAKHHPNRVKKIITLGTKFKWSPEIAAQESKMLNPEKIAEKIPAFASILEKKHYPNNWKEVLTKTSAMMMEMGEDNPLKLEDYQKINHQIKIGLADSDEMVTREETEEIVNALSKSHFYALSNSKHPIEKVNLEQLVHEIKEFLV
jgi:esterase/lipase